MELPKGLPKVLRSFKALHGLKKKFIDLHKFEKILALLIVFAVLQIGAILVLSPTVFRESQSSVKAAAEKLTVRQSKDVLWTVTSKYGFSVTFDSNIFKAEGTALLSPDGATDSYSGEKLLSPANLAVLNIWPTDLKENSSLTVLTSMRKDFFEKRRAEYGKNLSELELAVKHFAPKADKDLTYKLIKQEKVKIGEIEYVRSDYKETYTIFAGVTKEGMETRFVTVQNDKPYSVELHYKSDKSPYYKAFLGIIGKIKYLPPAADAVYLSFGEEPVLDKFAASKLDFVNKVAEGNGYLQVLGESTSPKQIEAGTVKVVATNTPAVVQVATLYCADISLFKPDKSTSLIGNSLCAASGGTGFFISGNGYIGTNGHVVAKLGPRYPLIFAILLKDREVIGNIIRWFVEVNKDYSPSQEEVDQVIERVIANENMLKWLAEDFYLLPESSFDVKNEKNQYAIQLGKDPIKIDLTKRGSESPIVFSSSVLEAKLIGWDYNPQDYEKMKEDPGASFTASDVALLKVEGKNFPFVKMGSIEGLVSGSEITVIGFPAIAENIAIETTESKATATKGIVSAIREAKGTKNKLIQSDVSIEGGNSGSPAFNSSGEVVGIATFSFHSESGSYNYMRDIQDLKNLVSKHNVALSEASETQKVWEAGLGKFLKAYYKYAVKDFTKVLSLYPPHVLAKEYTDIANQKIANGEDRSFPIAFYSLIGLVVVTGAGIGGVGFLVLRRRKASQGAVSQTPYGYPLPVPTPSTPIASIPTPQISAMPPLPTPAQAATPPQISVPAPTSEPTGPKVPIPSPPVPTPPASSIAQNPAAPTYQPSAAQTPQPTTEIPVPEPPPTAETPTLDRPPVAQEPDLPALPPLEGGGPSTMPTPSMPSEIPASLERQVEDEPVSQTPEPEENIEVEPSTPTAEAKKRVADLRSSLQQKVNLGGVSPETPEDAKSNA